MYYKILIPCGIFLYVRHPRCLFLHAFGRVVVCQLVPLCASELLHITAAAVAAATASSSAAVVVVAAVVVIVAAAVAAAASAAASISLFLFPAATVSLSTSCAVSSATPILLPQMSHSPRSKCHTNSHVQDIQHVLLQCPFDHPR